MRGRDRKRDLERLRRAAKRAREARERGEDIAAALPGELREAIARGEPPIHIEPEVRRDIAYTLIHNPRSSAFTKALGFGLLAAEVFNFVPLRACSSGSTGLLCVSPASPAEPLSCGSGSRWGACCSAPDSSARCSQNEGEDDD